ncbi:MAG: WD40 repeat domain-containing protein [Spirochaetales bacterium]|nr:WD40 repeat domain-containing protein [Spirochaetales bacterium]
MVQRVLLIVSFLSFCFLLSCTSTPVIRNTASTKVIWPADCRVLEGHEGDVLSVAFSRDGETLISGGGDKYVIKWDLKTNKMESAFTDESGGVLSEIDFVGISHDEKYVVSCSFDLVAALGLSVGTAAVLRGYPDGDFISADIAPGEMLASAEMSPDSDSVVLGGMYGEVRLWDITSRAKLWENVDVIKILTTSIEPVFSLRYSHDGKIIAAAKNFGTQFLDAKTGKEIKRFDGHFLQTHTAAFSSDDKVMATGGADNVIKIWDTRTRNLLREFRYVTEAVMWIEFSPDDKLIAVLFDQGILRLIDSETGEVRAVFKLPVSVTSPPKFSDDGKKLAFGAKDDRVYIYDLGKL